MEREGLKIEIRLLILIFVVITVALGAAAWFTKGLDEPTAAPTFTAMSFVMK